MSATTRKGIDGPRKCLWLSGLSVAFAIACGSSSPPGTTAGNGGSGGNAGNGGGGGGGTTGSGGAGAAPSAVVGNAKTFSYPSASGSYLNSPDLIAIDGTGKVWIGSRAYGVLVSIEGDSAAADCSTGCANLSLLPATLFDLVIDGSNIGWLALKSRAGSLGSPSPQDSALTSFSPDLTLISVFPTNTEKSGTTNGATVYQQAASTAVAVDNAGNVVLAGDSVFNQDGTLNESLDLVDLSATGDVLTSYAVPLQFQGPSITKIAVDEAGNAWTMSNGDIVEYPAASGTAVVFNGAGIGSNAVALAIDSSGSVWVANSASATDGGSVTKIAPDAPSDCSSGCTQYISDTYLSAPRTLAVDGADAVWVTAGFGSLSGPAAPQYDNSVGVVKISPGASADCSAGCTAYASDAFSTPNVELSGIAIDGGGNVWVLSYFSAAVIELPKIATATVTPLAAQRR